MDMIKSVDLQLLEHIQEHTTMKQKKYSGELQVFNFSEIEEKFNMTTNDIKMRLDEVFSKVSKIKCLRQMTKEAIELMHTSKYYRRDFTRYVDANLEKFLQKAKKKNLTLLDYATNKWLSLSENEKDQYSTEALKEEEDACTPFALFVKKKKKKDPTVSYNLLRTKYKHLSVEKKVKFIKKSVKLAHQEYKFSQIFDNSLQKSEVTHTNGPSKNDLQIYLKYEGLPQEPSRTPAMYYYLETLQDRVENGENESNILMQSIKLFKALSENDQKMWQAKYKKAWEKHQKDLANWKSNADDEVKHAYFFYEELVKKPVKATKKKKKTLSDIRNELKKSIEAVSHTQKFAGEPKVISCSPISLYVHECQEKGEKKLYKELEKRYYSNDTNKNVFIKKSLKMAKKMKQAVLEYCEDLSEQDLKDYIGHRRLKFLKCFHEDIFADKYPDSEFPVFLPLSKQRKKDFEKIAEMSKIEAQTNLKEEEMNLKRKKSLEEKPFFMPIKRIKRENSESSGTDIKLKEILSPDSSSDFEDDTAKKQRVQNVLKHKVKFVENSSSSNTKKRKSKDSSESDSSDEDNVVPSPSKEVQRKIVAMPQKPNTKMVPSKKSSSESSTDLESDNKSCQKVATFKAKPQNSKKVKQSSSSSSSDSDPDPNERNQPSKTTSKPKFASHSSKIASKLPKNSSKSSKTALKGDKNKQLKSQQKAVENKIEEIHSSDSESAGDVENSDSDSSHEELAAWVN